MVHDRSLGPMSSIGVWSFYDVMSCHHTAHYAKPLPQQIQIRGAEFGGRNVLHDAVSRFSLFPLFLKKKPH